MQKNKKPIYIHLCGCEPVALGGSHWFGYPDLPPGVPVPTVEEDGEDYALTLVCQINLSDLPKNDVFPKEGILQFYADIAYYGGEWDEPAIHMYPSDNKVCRVVYLPAEAMGDIESRKWQYADDGEIGAIPLSFDYKCPQLDEPDIQLLGATDHLEWNTWPEPCEEWQLLLQMDSMEGKGYCYNFVDWGVLCFIISPDALKHLDFSDVRAIILSA